MTEKRFTIKNERTLQDNLNGKTYVFSWKTDAEEICKIMNIFYEENMRIKRKNQRLIQWRNNQEKENEQLKSELSKKDIQLDFLKSENIHMSDLINENEQLKKELKRCKEWLNSDKYDYETTLAFIKSKGFSLKDVLEYEKEVKND